MTTVSDATISKDLAAANAAIRAATQERGPGMSVFDLITGIVSLWKASIMPVDSTAKGAALDLAAGRLIGLGVQLVGARRAHEKVDTYDRAGAGDQFQ